MQLDVSTKPRAAQALRLATKHHEGIERRYTGEPYINHPVRVAEILLGARFYSDEILAAALLHDCLEDKNIHGLTMPDTLISNNCGVRVLRWVQLLSNTEKGPRDLRKQRAAERIRNAPAEVRAIKLADIIDNCTGIADLDPDFAETYLREKEYMVSIMRTTSVPTEKLQDFTELRNRAKNVIAEGMNQLAMFALDRGLVMEEERKADDAMIAAMLDEDERSVFAEIALF
jgi:(p)ppGpp synthase/HD superfamily hydrolase